MNPTTDAAIDREPATTTPSRNPSRRANRRLSRRPAAAAGILLLLTTLACGGEPVPEPSEQDPSEPKPSATDAAAPAAAQSAEPAVAAAEPVTTPVDAVHQILGEGLDVSGHAGEIDWRAVREAGHTFAFVKATEGVDLTDPAFEAWWPAMKEAGLVRGAYHFYVTEDDPAEQAAFFISRAALGPGDLAPVVDVELIGHGTKPGLADRLRTLLSILEEHYGVKPILYTSPNFWNQHLGEGFGDHPLWIAEYGVAEPAVPGGWDHWHLWQHSDDAAVPGVEKAADLSRVNRSAGVDLSKLVIPPRAGS